MPDEHTIDRSPPAAGMSGAGWRWRQGLALLALVTGLALAGCGGGKSAGGSAPTPPPAPGPTPQERISQLEASGQLPQLERLPLIGGVDADNDGVRDDIADHIRKTYTDPVQYRAAMQVARALQATLLVDTHDHLALREVSDAGDRAIACVRRVAFVGAAHRLEGSRLLQELESLTTNTKERLQAYLAYNKAMSGSVSVGPEGSVCE
ncbi:MAG TPA: hypothetical protein PKC60_13575 [Hydrogenophaga sp.]|uniref:hypothetical protein n=1 Tax=Hydrogenophaga sp. TaxID=1904254 RepID=UPI002BAFF017|nr:hypothetical protein [Hydrogenophaga sp.]HMN94255.1 hypothetical protein [Hydrogenophaga sp.]HMP12220.1 hypothetical protein [Hydrogenophaga sp.]